MWTPLLLSLLMSLPLSTPVPSCELVRTDVRITEAVYGAAAASDGDRVFFAGGDGPHKLSGDILVYDPRSRGVRELRKVRITPRRYAGAAFFEGRLVVVGGSDRSQPLGVVEAVDVGREALEVWPELPSARAFAGVAAYRGELWVAGGEHGGHATNAVEIYDPKTKTWRNGPRLSVARATRLVVIDDVLWALPGYDGKEAVGVLERLDGDRWVRVEGAATVSAFASAPIDGGALLFGDYREHARVWVMAKDGAMTTTATAQIARRHAAAATARGRVVVLGGNRTSKNSSAVGVLEAFEARCIPAAEGQTCDALLARAARAFDDRNENGGRAALEEAAPRCGVGRRVWLRVAQSHAREGNHLEVARALDKELGAPGASPDAFALALGLAASGSATPEIHAMFAKLGRSHDAALSSARVKGQRAWVQRYACADGQAPAAIKQGLTSDELDHWTFTCGGAPGELWFDFGTQPIAAFEPRVP